VIPEAISAAVSSKTLRVTPPPMEKPEEKRVVARAPPTVKVRSFCAVP
jgi:hypothetical protein